MPKLRIGILGCARIVRRAIVAAARKASLVEITAIASRNGATAAAWAAEFGIPKHYDSYEALVADPGIDAVYIPLPNELHCPWTQRAAEAGKHVLCEKPLALNASDAMLMADACRRAGVVLVEAFMWRHHPRVAHAKKMLADGLLGDLRLVKMDFSFDIHHGDWRLDPARGGGALYDLGCYGINLARYFAGREPNEYIARGRILPNCVDMTLGVLLRFWSVKPGVPSDVIALVDCSFECPYRNRFEIVGTKGAIEFPDGVLPPEESTLVVRTAAGVDTIRFPAADQYTEMLDCFARSVAAGELEPPGEDGVMNMFSLATVRDTAISLASTTTCVSIIQESSASQTAILTREVEVGGG